jgi:hypothetical protein
MEVGHAEIEEDDDKKIVNTSNRIMPVIIPNILSFLASPIIAPLFGALLAAVGIY